jgi:phosphatidate cytidylyltransferase
MARIFSGLAMAAGVVGAVWFLTPSGLLIVALAVAARAYVEYARIAAAVGVVVPRWTTLVATLAACAMVPFPWLSIEVVLVLGLIASAVNVLLSDRSGPATLHDTAGAVLAPVYIGLPLGSLVGTAAVGGREAALILIATVAVSDTAQYYTGRWLGRAPLAARHSPKKTREGAIGGLLAAPVFLVFVGQQWLPWIDPWKLALLGALMAVAGMTGDLFESMLKRAADLKDSSHLIPGHGGVLDRIDALLFAAPIFYYFLRSA